MHLSRVHDDIIASAWYDDWRLYRHHYSGCWLCFTWLGRGRRRRLHGCTKGKLGKVEYSTHERRDSRAARQCCHSASRLYDSLATTIISRSHGGGSALHTMDAETYALLPYLC